jgi:hypothetical protein
VLGGVLRRIRTYRRLLPLHGLMASRYRGEYAVTRALRGQESHLHESSVIKDLAVSVADPPATPVSGERIARRAYLANA